MFQVRFMHAQGSNEGEWNLVDDW